MAFVTTATIAATAAAAAMYADAKLHITKDFQASHQLIRSNALYEKAAKENRLSLYNFFEASALNGKNSECIWSRSGCYTWTEAYNRANQYGQWFLSQDVHPGDLVAFYWMNCADFVLAWLGLWSIGAAPAMINYNLSRSTLLHCLRVAKCKLILVDEDENLRARIEGISRDLKEEVEMSIQIMDEKSISKIMKMKAERPDDSYREVVKGDWPTCLLYTSGTTGMPKACPLNTSQGFMVGCRKAAGYPITRPDDRWYNCMPMYHGTGGIVSVAQMMNGITLCIGKKFSTSKFWQEVHDCRATWITYVGETARYLLAAPPGPFDKDHCVRAMFGNGLRPDVWIKFRERFGIPEVLEFFGSTEGVFGLVNNSKGDYLAGAVGHHGLWKRFTTRKNLVPVKIDYLTGAIARDPKTKFAIQEPFETGGEIIVRVPAEDIFSGYFGNPEDSAKKFDRNVFEKGDLWYRSGDALRRTRDGRWYFMDRLGDTFRWKGENVSTAEVGECIGRFDGVVEANVYGVQLPNHDGRAGCAAIFIQPEDRSRFDFTGLLKHARTYLPRYAAPLFLRLVREMTPIHNNKQNKVPLRAEGVDPDKVSKGDEIWWVPAGEETYKLFKREDWESLKWGRAKL